MGKTHRKRAQAPRDTHVQIERTPPPRKGSKAERQQGKRGLKRAWQVGDEVIE